MKNSKKMIVIVGPNFGRIPITLEKVITKIDFKLPTTEYFKDLIQTFSKQTGVDPDFSIAEICKGLSAIEGENAISLSLVEHSEFNKEKVMEMKRNMIKKTGFMDFMEPEPLENLGGVENLVEYIMKRLKAWEDPSLPKLKSMFFSGIPGTGKTLAMKVVASIFGWPLILLDIGALKGSLVGQTEQNVRKATSIIDASGKSIVGLDEIEKSLSGANNLDDGVSRGLIGYLLTWLQESKGEKILIATSNDITSLPGEFLRAGR